MQRFKQQSHNLILLFCLTIGLFGSNTLSASRTESLKMYLYHQQPPFITGDINSAQGGLAFNLAQLLMQQKDVPQVRVEIRPRKRLDWELKHWLNGSCPSNTIQCDNNWMLFGVIPQWGWSAENSDTFNWVPLFDDADLLVSSRQNPIEYDGPSSLSGLTFAALHGHQYPGVLGEMMQDKQLIRDNGSSNLAVLQRVAKGRADITLVRRSTLNYLVNNDTNGLADKLHVFKLPYNSFTLQVMLPANRPDLHQWLTSALNTEAWQELLRKYAIKP
ncbi:transporter substrate-binding domain-containing protein [Lacimicrobium alkaliphilum]|uniref:ABC transporter substrate-binding protein n=1 Tax=Lacimicrobium alkaliphilum TaxID=1526571 RepID=A0ABQ1R3L6_9ALTE|nr:transporter substrate-binding domain-containing protein [Lacimicrobium alkaliphilum]GGD54915.1 ABC transporter substrate-binding protein [Lacimicrobium alkaliphilum]